MVQMVGVIVLALGLHQMFASINEGGDIDNRVMVVGYVVMRVPMIFLWARAARDVDGQQPETKRIHDGFRLRTRPRESDLAPVL